MDGLLITAEYYPSGDVVEVLVGVEVNGDLLAPADVGSVLVSLLKNQRTLLGPITVDRFYANSDFMYSVYFLHPPAIDGLEVAVTINHRNSGQTWRATRSVAHAAAEDTSGILGDNADSVLA